MASLSENEKMSCRFDLYERHKSLATDQKMTMHSHTNVANVCSYQAHGCQSSSLVPQAIFPLKDNILEVNY